MCFGGIQSGPASAAQGAQMPGDPNVSDNAVSDETPVSDPNPYRSVDPFVQQQFAEMNARVEGLRSYIESVAASTRQASADARTLRLREIAIDTAIRHLADKCTSSEIIKVAAVYYAFLDTGAVPA